MSSVIYIDADVLLYEASFAAQKTHYIYKKKRFTSADECKTWCEANELDYRALRKDGTITSEIELLPQGTARTILARKIDGITDTVKIDKTEMFLSGEGNYRDEVAVTKGYKANRANTPKPQHYDYIRSLLLEWGCILINGCEADDAIGISMTKNPDGVIATIDKDLNQIPGKHYDWGKGLMYTVKPIQAHHYFLRQLLIGDSTDNIPGLPKYGEAKADKTLNDIKTNHNSMWTTVIGEYKAAGMTKEYFTEQMQLLWIQREPDQRITPIKYQKEYVKA